MGIIQSVTVRLATGNESDWGTDDPVYVGSFGPGGGREYPVFIVNFDDYDEGSDVRYLLGEDIGSSTTKQVTRSKPGETNDPARLPVELSSVQFVYLRKHSYGNMHDPDTAGTAHDEGDDDAWHLEDATVTLFDSSDSRTFELRAPKGAWFGTEFGHTVYLSEFNFLGRETEPAQTK